tara:strand:- start:99 stop:287 length:189 start_codon:yes stop_codon:yes gene_type:complete
MTSSFAGFDTKFHVFLLILLLMMIMMRRNIHSLVSSARAVFVVLEKREFRRREKEGEKAPPR